MPYPCWGIILVVLSSSMLIKITLLGWGSLLKGAFGILLPDLSDKIIQRINLSPVVIYPTGVVFLLVGCYMLFYGFFY